MTERLIAGRFLIGEPLGHGGMGTVWRAEDQVLGRVVALKEVQVPSMLAAPERNSLRERVIREARAAAKLSHPSAVTVFDVIEEGDNIFIAMELVGSPTLSKIVEEEGPFSPSRAAQAGLAVLDALEVAHANGIVHRDVKPANIMVGADGRIKLADFGVASIKGDPRLTATGMVIGSPSYMSPEQARGLPAEPASDMWGLGATLFFAVEGKGPFDRPGPIPTLMAITKEDHPVPHNAGPLEPVIGSLLSKDPERRPSSEELKPLLQRIAANGSGPRPTLPAEPGFGTGDTQETEPVVLPEQEPTLREVAPPPPPPFPPPERTPPPPRRAPPVVVQAASPPRPVTHRTLPPPDRRSRRYPKIIGAVVALLILGAFLIPRLFDGGSETLNDPSQAEGRGTGSTRGSTVAPADETGREKAEAGPLPGGWVTQSLGNTGYTIGRPRDWQVVENPIGDGSSTRLEGPNGRYLLVDWTDKPGEDAARAWEEQAASYARRHDNYRQIRIAPTSFKGFPTAAMWEWTYSSGGAELRAANLGFADDEWGFALNFQTRSSDWEDALPIYEDFQRTFSAG